MAATLATELLVVVFVIDDAAGDDERSGQWMLDAMGPLQPHTVGQYWGDSDQRHREVRCLTEEAWSRLQVIRQAWDPDERFLGFPAAHGQYRNINGWELSGEPTHGAPGTG